jgi:hypothetical protein
LVALSCWYCPTSSFSRTCLLTHSRP